MKNNKIKLNYSSSPLIKGIIGDSLAFTLIEMIVGITISMLLMTSIGVFMTNGIHNILSQKQALENNSNYTYLNSQIQNTISLIGSGTFIEKTSSGILFKRNKHFGEGGFSYIGFTGSSIDTNGDGIYCSSGSEAELINTNHLFIKSFIPFEEEHENMFTNFDDILSSKEITVNGDTYKSFQKEHRVAVKNLSNRDTIVGKEIFGDKFIEGANGTDIYLNHPTGLASDGTNLFISDTLNNRILYLDSSNKIHLLLDEYDGLDEPTGLYYNNTNKSLYIANSGNGEILEYSSEDITSPEIDIDNFSESINKIEIDFTSNNLTNLGTWNITGYSGDFYLTGTTNKLEYYFISKDTESNQPSCSGTEIKFTLGKPNIYCTKAGSGQIVNYNNSPITEIKINTLNDFSATGSYYINFKLFDSSENLDYQKYFPYFTQSDDNILTKGDNTLFPIESNLNYPTGLWAGGVKYETNGIRNGYNGSNYNPRTFSNLSLNYNENDTIFEIPIKSLNIDMTNDLLSIVGKYYKKYSCFKDEEKIENTYLFKKSLK